MKNLDYKIQDYNSHSQWDYVGEICRLAESLKPEQTLRVCVGTSIFEESIKDLKHAANKLKQSLFGRIFGWTPSVRVQHILLTTHASWEHSVYLDIYKHKQKKEVA